MHVGRANLHILKQGENQHNLETMEAGGILVADGFWFSIICLFLNTMQKALWKALDCGEKHMKLDRVEPIHHLMTAVIMHV